PGRRTVAPTRVFGPLAPRRGPPLALHSVPTRRSSDLGHARGAGRLTPHGAGSLGEGRRALSRSDRDQDRLAGAQSPDAALAPARSEEHTSELQSRENLVCRLLLGKKKAPLPAGPPLPG